MNYFFLFCFLVKKYMFIILLYFEKYFDDLNFCIWWLVKVFVIEKVRGIVVYGVK